MLTKRQHLLKRSFDLACTVPFLILLFPLIVFLFVCSSFSTKSFGIFFQPRVGRYGQIYNIIKIKTMRNSFSRDESFVSTASNPRITRFGSFLRKYKLDELPQLINVVKGDMSLVGPRPDVPGFADCLKDNDRCILSLRPGITGPSSLYFSDEEYILAQQQNPELYNATVIWPEKVSLNKQYLESWSFASDVRIILLTIFHIF